MKFRWWEYFLDPMRWENQVVANRHYQSYIDVLFDPWDGKWWENVEVIDYVPNPGGYVPVHTVSINALEDFVEKHTGKIRLSSVINPSESSVEPIYVRRSNTRPRTVYVRLPLAFSSGVYLSCVEAGFLKGQLEHAYAAAQTPLPVQSVRIVYEDGTVELRETRTGGRRIAKVDVIR